MNKKLTLALFCVLPIQCGYVGPDKAHGTNNQFMPEVDNRYTGRYPETYLPQPVKSIPILNPAQKAQAAAKAQDTITKTVSSTFSKLATDKQITESISTITKMTTEQKKTKALPSQATMPTDYYQVPTEIDYNLLTEKLFENFQNMRKDPKFTQPLGQVIQTVYLDSLKAMKRLDADYVDAFQSYVTVLEQMANITIDRTTGSVSFKQPQQTSFNNVKN